MLCELQQITQKVGLKINYNKIKMMTNLVPNKEVIIEDAAVEIVEKYIYLGRKMRISRDNQIAELLRRRTIRCAVFEKLCDIFKVPMKLKRKVFNQCVLPVLTYGAETLTLTKTLAMKLLRMKNSKWKDLR